MTCFCLPAQKPVILTGPTEQKVAKDRNVTIPCGVEGKPKPEVMWYKGDQRLLGDRYKIMPNGDLHIKVTLLLKKRKAVHMYVIAEIPSV